jgi:phosphatidylinositol alpha-1,6-mannosyltransferase
LLAPDAEAFEDAFSVYWHGSGRPGTLTRMDRAHFATRALALAASWRPDIVHSAHVNLGPLVSTMARLAGAEKILNVYGLEIWSGLKSSRRTHLSLMDRVIADCHFTADYVAGEKLHGERPTVIWDPVDLDRFAPGEAAPAILEKYGIPDPTRHFVVMSLGRLARAAVHKGFDRLIEAVARLAPAEPSLRLVIAGRGDDRERLEALGRERGLADRIHFTGSVEEADLAGVYRAAHVFSLVSDRGHGRGEGIPLTPLEAMACGAAVIVGNKDGSQEAVVGGRNGFVVSPRDPEALPRVLKRLMEDASLLADKRAQARRVAEEHFSFANFVEKHRALLEATARSNAALRKSA